MNALIKKHILFVLFSVFYLVFSLITYKDYGITSDEQLNYRAGKIYFKYIFLESKERKLLAEKVSPKDNPESFPYYRLYPGIVSLLNIKSYYEWAHLLNLFFGYLSFIGVYLLTLMITESKLSIFAPVLLFLNPHFFGHIPANPKDIPFASLYIFCFYLIFKINVHKIHLLVILGILIGLVMGMRVVGASLVVLLILRLVRYPKAVKGLMLTLSVACLTLFLSWPYLWQDSVHKIIIAISGAKNYAFWDRQILFDGNLIAKEDRPWYYLFTYILLKTPIVILCGLIGSFFIKSVKVYLLHAIILLNLTLYLIIQPTIYNEMRHFLYLVPLFTVLATVFLIRTIKSKNMVVSRLTLLIVILSLFKLSYDFISLHPYQYVYFNELAGNYAHVSKKYEFDYWSVSYKESAEYIRSLKLPNQPMLKVYPCNLSFGVDYYSHKNFIVVNKSAEADYYICDYMNSLINTFALDYEVVYEVNRKGAVLSYVAKTIK